jgi:hypothetical protein
MIACLLGYRWCRGRQRKRERERERERGGGRPGTRSEERLEHKDRLRGTRDFHRNAV